MVFCYWHFKNWIESKQPRRVKPMINVIGIVGRARSGKDTAALHLMSMNNKVIRRALADCLKEDVVKLKLAEPEHIRAKDSRTRRILQVWGTEHGRCVDPDYWFLRWSHWVLREQARRPFEAVVIPDIRFLNEAKACLEIFNGHLLFIDADERLGRNEFTHASEQDFPEIVKQCRDHCRFEYINNNCSLGLFKEQCTAVFKEWGYGTC